MAPKRRTRKNSDLVGTNIKVIKRPHGFDYYYKMPDGKLVGLKDHNGVWATREEAIEAALLLNQHLRKSGDVVRSVMEPRIGSPAKSVDNLNTILDLILKLDAKPLKKNLEKINKGKVDRTLEEKLYKVKKYREQWGDKSISSFTTKDIADFLDKQEPHPYIKHRALLKGIFNFAIQRGFIEKNPVDATELKEEPKRVSERHTIEGIKKIYEASPDWLKRAIKLALLTLQRREDLVLLTWKDIDLDSRQILINQGKAEGYDTPVYITIAMGDDLYSVIKECLNSGIHCPYVLHYRPTRTSTKKLKSKHHPFAITPDHLTKSFAKVRDDCGAYAAMDIKVRPSLHDLRALGSYLYQQAGFAESYIQSLDGHANWEMTKRYIDGHEKPKPISVSADLSLQSIFS